MPDDWLASGSVEMLTKANETAIDLYDNYKPQPLTKELQKKLRGIVNEAERHYQVKLSVE